MTRSLEQYVQLFRRDGSLTGEGRCWSCRLCTKYVRSRNRTQHAKYHHHRELSRGMIVIVRGRTYILFLILMSRYTEALAVLRNEICHLKKHDGQTWEWVADNDPSYARWVVQYVESIDDEIREALDAVLS